MKDVTVCNGTNCPAINGKHHSFDCLKETAISQGWPPPVIVAKDADAAAMNELHGEAYGIDWVYQKEPTP